jgi:hypothetical protein
MAKDGFYFPHFSNSRHDRKIKRIIKELGVEGYGLYFMTLEVLREQTDFKYPLSDIDLLADDFNTSEAKLKTVVMSYDLFQVDLDNNFFSEKFLENMQPYLKMKEQRSLAGKKSAEKRQEILNSRSTSVQQSKVNKVNKVNEINDIESFMEFRKKEYSKYSENFLNRLDTDFFISCPIIYTTDKINDPYKDFVDIIYQAITDNDWIIQISRDTDKSKIRHKLTEFIKYCLTSQCFRTEKYNSHYEFQKHFVNKYLKK